MIKIKEFKLSDAPIVVKVPKTMEEIKQECQNYFHKKCKDCTISMCRFKTRRLPLI